MKKIFITFLFLVGIFSFAQDKLIFVFGNFDFLKDQTEVNVVLNFDNVLFMKENFTESEYLERRKNDILANPKRGNTAWKSWSQEWEKYKKEDYLDYFLMGINSRPKKTIFKKGIKSKYTLIIDTKWIYAGWFGGGIGSQDAKLTTDLKVVESENPSKIIMKIQGDQILGRVSNKEINWEYGRIAAAYKTTGRELVNAIKKTD